MVMGTAPSRKAETTRHSISSRLNQTRALLPSSMHTVRTGTVDFTPTIQEGPLVLAFGSIGRSSSVDTLITPQVPAGPRLLTQTRDAFWMNVSRHELVRILQVRVSLLSMNQLNSRRV